MTTAADMVARRPACGLKEACPHCGGTLPVYCRNVCSRAYDSAASRAARRRARREPVSVADELEALARRLEVDL